MYVYLYVYRYIYVCMCVCICLFVFLFFFFPIDNLFQRVVLPGLNNILPKQIFRKKKSKIIHIDLVVQYPYVQTVRGKNILRIQIHLVY